MWRSWDQEKVYQTCAREAIEAGDTGYIYKYGNNEARNENEGISEHSNTLESDIDMEHHKKIFTILRGHGG